MGYVPLSAPQSISGLTKDGTWRDLDLDSVIANLPSTVSGVALMARNYDSVTGKYLICGFRMNGSSDNRTESIHDATYTAAAGFFIIGVDASHILEYNLSGTTTAWNLYVVGYFTTGFSFYTNGVNKSPTPSGSYTDVDGGVSGAAGYIFEAYHNGTPAYTWQGIRCNGSTDANHAYQTYGRNRGIIIKCDASGLVEIMIPLRSTQTEWWLLGYITSTDVVLNTNATNISLASSGSYLDIAASPAGAIANIVEVVSNSASYVSWMRINGGTTDYKASTMHVWEIVPVDASRVSEGYISSTNSDFYLIGYFTQTSGITVKVQHYAKLRRG